ncbi:hypothetical protein [Aestuariivivens insulae]|uniref:hypothetical protein n=1 Tax=Aestuariivivens insulae TaxID=1621988 RepID=UPI001F57BE43|nr:hypothetical protein [Aestuariivivens insulae]
MTENQTDEYFEIIYKPKSSIFSGDYLKIIPSDPNFEPTKEQQKIIINHLAKEYPNNEIKSTLSKNVEFIDSGGNFDSVKCNLCGKNIEIEDWQNDMDRAYQNSFSNLTFQTLCCQKETSLNELEYNMPCGFSKYQIEIINPGIENIEQIGLIKNIESIIDKKIKLIWAHY